MLERGLASALNNIKNGLAGPIRTDSEFMSKVGKVANLAPLVSAGAQVLRDGPLGFLDKHTLVASQSRSDPLLNHLWFALPPNVSGVSLPWYYIEEFTAPFRSFDVLTQYRAGKMFHFAGQHSISNLSVRFYDDSTGKVGRYLEAWRRTVLNADGTYNYPGGSNGYKKNFEVVVLDVTKFGQVYQFKFIGCWPTTAEPFNLSSATSERLISAQEFACDEVEITVRNFPPFSLIGIIRDGINSFQGAGLDYFRGTGDGAVDAALGAYTSDF